MICVIVWCRERIDGSSIQIYDCFYGHRSQEVFVDDLWGTYRKIIFSRKASYQKTDYRFPVGNRGSDNEYRTTYCDVSRRGEK